MRIALRETATSVLAVLLIFIACVMAGSLVARTGPAGAAGSAVIGQVTPDPHP